MKRITTAALFLMLVPAALLYAADPSDLDSFPIAGDEDVTKARLVLGNDRWIQPHFFLQAGWMGSKTWDRANGETRSDARWQNDAFIRACRLIFNGQFASNVYFYVATDDLKAGKSSAADKNENSDTGKTNLYTQDAYIKFVARREFQVYVGLLTVPLSRQNLQSEATLLGVERNPLMRGMDGYSNNGRDTGLMVRGFVPFLEYRVGVFRGFGRSKESTITPTRNKKDYPRFAARLQATSGDKEEGYFYSENYLGKRDFLSFGIGADFQPDVGKHKEDYFSIASDMSFETPTDLLGKNAITAQVGGIKTWSYPVDANVSYDGFLAYYIQLGMLFNDTVQPMARFTYRKETGTGARQYQTITGGINYYINGHYANIRLGVDIPIGKNTKYEDQYKGVLQFQGYL
jgi:hypothetical protein